MITRVCRITNHPISDYPKKIKEIYVMGLGYILHRLSNGHPNMKLLFEQWGYSIICQNVSMWFNSDDETTVRRAIALHRIGLRFFRLIHQFYFDCFYLTETFNKSLLDSLYSFLTDSGSNIFTRSALENTFKYFNEGNAILKVRDSLENHRSENITFSRQPEKRILVVATVSAGKSTLINALTGYNFNRAKNGVCTTHLCKIHNKRECDGITFRRGAILNYDNEIDCHTSDDLYEVAFHFESTLGDLRICLIDTPGVNNAIDTKHLHITSDAIKAQNYDCIIFISNGQYNGTKDEYRLLKLLKETTDKPILFVLNHLDKFKSKVDDIGKMLRNYGNELIAIGFEKPMIFPISAQYAYLLRTEHNLDEDEKDELDMMRKRFSNAYLDLKRYTGVFSLTELEKSGIIQLELAIKNT